MSSNRRNNQSPVIRILWSLASDLGIVIIVALTILAVYLFDTITPLGEPVWLLYFITLILSLWSSRDYAVPLVCIVTIIFLIGGFFPLSARCGGIHCACLPVCFCPRLHQCISYSLDYTPATDLSRNVVIILKSHPILVGN